MTRDIWFLSELRQQHQQDAGEAFVQSFSQEILNRRSQSPIGWIQRIRVSSWLTSRAQLRGNMKCGAPLAIDPSSLWGGAMCMHHHRKNGRACRLFSSQSQGPGNSSKPHFLQGQLLHAESPVTISRPFPLPAGSVGLLLPALREAPALPASALPLVRTHRGRPGS